VVVIDSPAARHEVIMLDYGGCGADGEPRVIYHNTGTDVGAEHTVVLTTTFATFVTGLSERPEE
jgi:hypothetical protein